MTGEWTPDKIYPETDNILSAKLAGNISVIKFVKKVAGEEGLLRVLELLPEQERRLYGGTLLVSRRISERSNMLLVNAVIKAILDGDPERAVEMGRFIIEDGLNLFYRFFYKVGSPKFIIHKSALLWKQYHKLGRIEISDLQANSVRVKLFFPYLTVGFCRTTIGTAIRSLELSGARNVKSRHETCIGKGDDHCTYFLKWQQ